MIQIDESVIRNYMPVESNVPERVYSTNDWVKVTEDTIVYNYEMLYAFYDPQLTNSPSIRVARITEDNNFLIWDSAIMEYYNFGDYRKLQQPLYHMSVPSLPKEMWPCIY